MYSSSNLDVFSNFTDIKILITTGESIKGTALLQAVAIKD